MNCEHFNYKLWIDCPHPAVAIAKVIDVASGDILKQQRVCKGHALVIARWGNRMGIRSEFKKIGA